jgi:hypothetical protein
VKLNGEVKKSLLNIDEYDGNDGDKVDDDDEVDVCRALKTGEQNNLVKMNLVSVVKGVTGPCIGLRSFSHHQRSSCRILRD